MTALEYIPPETLRGAWSAIRQAVEQIRERCGEPWLTEDVYSDVKCGAAQLWARPGLDGFVIIKPQPDPYGAGTRLLVWLAWSAPGTSEIVEQNTAQLREMAQASGMCGLVFESPRRGWERRAPALGWRADMTRYVMEV